MKQNIREALDRYVRLGIPTGSFTRAMLEHDLSAVVKADEESLRDIREIYIFIHQELPSECHGSKEKVAAWIKSFAEQAKGDVA